MLFCSYGSDESILEDNDNGLEGDHGQEAKNSENVQMLDNNWEVSASQYGRIPVNWGFAQTVNLQWHEGNGTGLFLRQEEAKDVVERYLRCCVVDGCAVSEEVKSWAISLAGGHVGGLTGLLVVAVVVCSESLLSLKNPMN